MSERHCLNEVALTTNVQISRLLGAFAKLRKATIDFVVYVLPSVRIEQLGSNWTDFDEI